MVIIIISIGLNFISDSEMIKKLKMANDIICHFFIFVLKDKLSFLLNNENKIKINDAKIVSFKKLR